MGNGMDGGDATIIAQPEAAYFLMHPGQESWQMTPGAKVGGVAVLGADEAAATGVLLGSRISLPGSREHRGCRGAG
jgi:hypothetical protein